MIVRFLIAVVFGIAAIDVVTVPSPSMAVRLIALFTLVVAAGGAVGLLGTTTPATCRACGRKVNDPIAALECDQPHHPPVARMRPSRKPGQTRTGWSA